VDLGQATCGIQWDRAAGIQDAGKGGEGWDGLNNEAGHTEMMWTCGSMGR